MPQIYLLPAWRSGQTHLAWDQESERARRFKSCRWRITIRSENLRFSFGSREKVHKKVICRDGGVVKRASLESWFLHGNASSNLVPCAFKKSDAVMRYGSVTKYKTFIHTCILQLLVPYLPNPQTFLELCLQYLPCLQWCLLIPCWWSRPRSICIL